MVWSLSEIEVSGHCIACVAPPDARARPGPLIVFLHGINLTAGFWPHVMPADMLRTRWVSASLPAHPPSRVPPGFAPENVSAALLTDITARVAARFGDGRSAVVVGHSTGALAALAFAARRPDRCGGVVSVCGFARPDWGGLPGFLMALAKAPTGHGFALALKSAVLTNTATGLALASAAARRRAAFAAAAPLAPALRADLRHADGRALRAFFRGVDTIDVTGELGRIACPVHVLSGAEDRVVHSAAARAIHDAVPGAHWEDIAGAAHMPMLEAPDAFWPAVRRALAACGAPPDGAS